MGPSWAALPWALSRRCSQAMEGPESGAHLLPVCLGSILAVDWDLISGRQPSTYVWPLCAAWASPELGVCEHHGLPREKLLPFPVLVSESHRVTPTAFDSRKQSQRSAQLQGRDPDATCQWKVHQRVGGNIFKTYISEH